MIAISTADSYAAGGWAEGGLGVIYDTADSILSGLHPESDAYALVKRIRDDAERADVAIERERF